MRTITLSSRLVLLATGLCLDEKKLGHRPTFTLRDLLLKKTITCWGNDAVRIVECKDGLVEDMTITAKDDAPFAAKSVSYCHLQYWLGLYGLELLTDTVACA